MTTFNLFPAVMLPVVVVGAGLCLVLLLDLFLSDRWPEAGFVGAMAVLVAAAWTTAGLSDATVTIVAGGSFIADPVSRFLDLFAYAVVAAVFLYARFYWRARPGVWGEFYLLGLFALLGIIVMTSGYSLLVMYLGLELLSLSLYVMVAFDRESPVASESAMKYFVLGAIASGTLLYGISIIYGITGTLNLGDIAAVLRTTGPAQIGLLVGVAFVLVGIAFKFGAVPFHSWLPDVYHGAPACVGLFISTAPKIAAFALAFRVLVEGLGPVGEVWQAMLAVLAVLSLAIGNLLAIAQTNIKRMLGYSTISHVGFILLGFAAGTQQGVSAALYYTLVYVLMSAAAFGTVILLTRDSGEAEQLDDFRGLSQRSPWFALVMLIVMVSMIGVPPLAGFFAKWWILAALLERGFVWLAIAGVSFSVIGAFYYLRVIWLMYFDKPVPAPALRPGLDMRIVLSLNGLLVLALGLLPGRVLELCSRLLG